jgi:hypothetical protein
MRRLFLICALATALHLAATRTPGQTTSSTSSADAAKPTQDQLIGEVTSIDTANGRIAIRTDAGASVSFKLGEETVYLRVAPGERTLSNAGRIARADLKTGDRVLIRSGATAVDGGQAAARQVVVMNAEAQAAGQERLSEDWRRRGIAGRITALNPETKEITVAARSREGLETIIINASANTRLLRYAPDSVRMSDARNGSFAELKIGDQLRALGERSSDGTHFTPEEIIAGSFTRASGTVTAVDAAKGEIRIKDEQTGKSLTVALGSNSTLRRLPADFVETLAQRTAERRAAAAAGNGSTNAQTGMMRSEERPAPNRNDGERVARERRGGGRSLQQLLESQPALNASDLKKGDMVILTGTTSASSDQSRITAIILVTGDAVVMKRLQQLQGQDGSLRNMSPGLPGDVIGGGTTERERP